MMNTVLFETCRQVK